MQMPAANAKVSQQQHETRKQSFNANTKHANIA
jgi:hypothetical protein